MSIRQDQVDAVGRLLHGNMVHLTILTKEQYGESLMCFPLQLDHFRMMAIGESWSLVWHSTPSPIEGVSVSPGESRCHGAGTTRASVCGSLADRQLIKG